MEIEKTESQKTDEAKAAHFSAIKDAFTAYENGKARRYGLLFAVNGGTFALAKLLSDTKSAQILQSVALFLLAAGMICFTVLMCRDIKAFGEKMRDNYLPSVFGPKGEQLLKYIQYLLIIGWIMVVGFAVLNLFPYFESLKTK